MIRLCLSIMPVARTAVPCAGADIEPMLSNGRPSSGSLSFAVTSIDTLESGDELLFVAAPEQEAALQKLLAP